jgi:hypothetical protein
VTERTSRLAVKAVEEASLRADWFTNGPTAIMNAAPIEFRRTQPLRVLFVCQGEFVVPLTLPPDHNSACRARSVALLTDSPSLSRTAIQTAPTVR